LPLDGEEKRHLVPVDWVAQAVARIVQQPALQGRTYHLVAAEPVPVSRIKAAAEEILQIDGVSFSGRRKLTDPSTLEELFLSRLAEYEPYLRGDPDFDSKNTRAALADLPAPCVDRACLVRLLRYAKAANWGKSKRKPRHGWSSRCAQYVEEFFPEAARRSVLASLPLDVTVRLEITEGGRWLYRWVAGALTSVVRDGSEPAEVTYQLDLTTFENVTSGLVSPQDAFATQDIAIKGDIEKGLKLAVLFSQFVKEFPYPKDAHLEDSHAVALVP
jgi:putative sterol carrier protein